MNGAETTVQRLRVSGAQLLAAVAWCVLPLPCAWLLNRDGQDPTRLLCGLLAAEAAWILFSWRSLTGSLFNPYALFVVIGLLFNGGQAFLELGGWNEEGLLGGAFQRGELVATLGLVMGAYGGLHLGALLGADRGRLPACAYPGPDAAGRTGDGPLRAAGWWLLAGAMGPFLVVLQGAVAKVVADGYLALFQQAEPAGLGSLLQTLAFYIFPGALAVILGSRGRGVGTWLALGILLSYAGVLLFLGSRFHAVGPLVATAWLWNRAIRPLPSAPFIAAAAALVFVVFPLVRATRGESGADRASVAFLRDAFADLEAPVVTTLWEMGGCMGTITETMRLVPDPHSYELGEGYAYAALTVLPSLFWTRHPTITRGLPGTWLTEQADPGQAALGGSLGFSFIAEAFLNFGWAAPLLMILVGSAIVRLWLWSESAGPAGLVLMASFLPSLLFFTRNDATFIFRPLLWYGLGSYAFIRLLQGKAAQGGNRASRDPP